MAITVHASAPKVAAAKLTRDQKNSMIEDILDAQRKEYAEGEGDFDDARRHYRNDADDYEILDDFKRWCKGKTVPAKASATQGNNMALKIISAAEPTKTAAALVTAAGLKDFIVSEEDFDEYEPSELRGKVAKAGDIGSVLFDLTAQHKKLVLSHYNVYLLVHDAAGKPVCAIDAELNEAYAPRNGTLDPKIFT